MKPLRILVVEDEIVIAMLVAELLEGLGHTVTGVETTQSGTIAAAARDRPDLMIVDARLREGSGLVAVAEVLRGGFVPHIFVSGDPLRERNLHPAAVVIEKPFDDTALVAAIDRAVPGG